MKTLELWIVLTLVALCAGCSANGGGVDELPARRIDPNDVPTQFTLHSPVPVLLATFEASESGYEVRLAQGQGAPSPTIDTSRDVVVRALDAGGEPLAVVSVFNPRDVHTAGASDPDTAVRERGSFTVAFARPEQIRTLELKVVRGANSGLERRIPVDLDDVPQQDPDQGQYPEPPQE